MSSDSEYCLSSEGWLKSGKEAEIPSEGSGLVTVRSGLISHSSLDSSGSEASFGPASKKRKVDASNDNPAEQAGGILCAGEAVRRARLDPVWSSDLLTGFRPNPQAMADLMSKSTYINDLYMTYCRQRVKPVVHALDVLDVGFLCGAYCLARRLKSEEADLEERDIAEDEALLLCDDMDVPMALKLANEEDEENLVIGRL